MRAFCFSRNSRDSARKPAPVGVRAQRIERQQPSPPTVSASSGELPATHSPPRAQRRGCEQTHAEVRIVVEEQRIVGVHGSRATPFGAASVSPATGGLTCRISAGRPSIRPTSALVLVEQRVCPWIWR